MALHTNFPESPYTLLGPAIRWFPADEALPEHKATVCASQGSKNMRPQLVIDGAEEAICE